MQCWHTFQQTGSEEIPIPTMTSYVYQLRSDQKVSAQNKSTPFVRILSDQTL